MHSTLKSLITIIAIVAIVMCVSCEAKLLRRSRYFDDYSNGQYETPYAGATGERAIITVRGARNHYDGSAPSKIMIEDNPYRGHYPRGVYGRLDSGYGRAPMYPRPDPYSGFGSLGGLGGFGGYGGSYARPPMYGAPSRIAVTGAFPYGYGSRF